MEKETKENIFLKTCPTREKTRDVLTKVTIFLISTGILWTGLWFNISGSRIMSDHSAYLLIGIVIISGMIMTAQTIIYNPVFSMSSFSVLFLLSIIFMPEDAYINVCYLATILLTEQFKKHATFKRRGRFFLAIGAYFFAYLFLGHAIFIILGGAFMKYGMGWAVIANLVFACINSLFDTITGVLLSRYLPEKALRFLDRFAYKKIAERSESFSIKELFSGRLSSKVSLIITSGILILGISGALFSNMLLSTLSNGIYIHENPDVSTTTSTDSPNTDSDPASAAAGTETDISVYTYSEDDETGIAEHFYSEGDGNGGQYTIKFALNRAGIIFDVKLVLMLLCVATPMITYLNLFAQIYVTRPVSQMSAIMKRFMNDSGEERKQYVEQIVNLNIANTNDEISELHDALRKMTFEVSEYIDLLKEEQALQNEVEIAKKANEAKSAFLSSMSHEIRTPINAVLGMDEMILRETEDENIRKYAFTIQNAGQTLLALINDILDFSRIEAGKQELIPVEYDLSSMITDLINDVRPRAEKKGLALNVSVDRNIPYLLYGDEIRIKQVILNILTNAAKYTEKGSINFSTEFERADSTHIRLLVHVRDTGIGIKPEDIEKLFKPFERVDEERNRNIEGTGLGLSITRQLLELMGSSLQVESEYGKGSDFWFSLLQETRSDKPVGDIQSRFEESVKNLKKYKESFTAPDCRIIVVDDTKTNLEVICGLLKKTKLRIDTADSGYEFLKKSAETCYDAILLDHRMPGMDGIETLHAMKQEKDNPNLKTPCIALTANAVHGARELYIGEGFDDYLTKPVNPEKLEAMLIEYLPKDKLTITTEADDTEEKLQNFKKELSDLLPGYSDIEGINTEQAFSRCGDAETLKNAVLSFYSESKEKHEKIKNAAETGNYRDFTILVHALKSSSGLLGATGLSEKAKHLEALGNQENGTEIARLAPELLEGYAALSSALAKYGEKDEDAFDPSLPEIPVEDLKEAYAAVREFAEADDFDSAESIMEGLAGFFIPESEQERYKELKKFIKKYDREGIMRLTES